MKRIAAVAALAVVALVGPTEAGELAPMPPIDDDAFTPIDDAVVTPVPAPPQAIVEPIPVVIPPPAPVVVQPKPKAVVIATPKPTTRSIGGWASWYCSKEIPVCHYAYPPGSMVAAACGKLRAAIGPKWRGKYVTVATRTRHVRVRLVDWCGSTTKTIDLYREPMRRLGGTGTLRVRISW